MNNSSAYNNVLLKPTVPTQAAQAPVQKRTYQDDRSPVSFQQNFKDVHDSLRERDEKIAKPATTKKAAQVDNKSTHNTERKSPSPTKKADESSSREQVSDHKKTTDKSSANKNITDKNANENVDSNNSLAKQNADEQNIDAKKTESEVESKSIGLDGCIDEHLSADTLVADVILANPNVPTPMPVSSPTNVTLTPASAEVEETAVPTTQIISPAQILPSAQIEAKEALASVIPVPNEAEALVSAPVKVEETVAVTAKVDEVLAVVPVVSETKAQVEAKSETPTDTTSDSLAIDANPLVETTKNGISSLINKQTKADEPSPDTDEGTPVAADIDVTTGIAQALMNTPQAASSVATPEAVAEQAPAVLAAVGSAVLPKPVLAQAKAAPITDNRVDVEASGSLADSLTTEKQSIKAVVGDPHIASAPDAAPTQTQPQTLDPKSTFEKTLQSMILPDSSKREESAAASIPAPTSSTPSSSTNALDSMLRFSDAQTPAARSFVVQTAVPVPVGQPQWSQAVGEKVLWLAAQNVSAAEIHLNPENLGPVQVRVSVNQEQTTVNFTSHHALVREVLDQNLGRLRDMFSEQGLNLVNVDVSDKSFSRQQGEAKDQQGQANSNNTQVEDEAPVAMSLIKQQRLVDHYA